MSKRYANSVRKFVELAEGRQIILWGDDELTHYVYDDFNSAGVEIKYVISESKEGHYKNIDYHSMYNLLLEEREKIVVIVIVLTNHGEIYQKLVDMGFEYGKDFYVFAGSGYNAEFDVIDSILGYNRYYGDVLGFQVYGDLNTPGYRILALGGSTTAPTVGNNKSWPEFLFESLRRKIPDIKVINGGMSGYAANYEFFKFVRDGILFNPDMLITFDGFNDVDFSCVASEFPCLHPYTKKTYDKIQSIKGFSVDTLLLRNAQEMVYGIKSKEKDFEIYIRFQKMIHAVAEACQVKHLGFFQPMIYTGKTILTKEHRTLVEKIVETQRPNRRSYDMFYHNVLNWIQNETYMIDLTDIFDGRTDMYYDFCHATEEGNELIAQSIERHILKHMGEKIC